MNIPGLRDVSYNRSPTCDQRPLKRCIWIYSRYHKKYLVFIVLYMNILKVSLPRFMMLFVINITLQRDVNVLLFNFADGNELLMLSRSYCTWCKCDENIFTWYCSILLMAMINNTFLLNRATSARSRVWICLVSILTLLDRYHTHH